MEVIRFVLDGKPYKTAPETSVCDGCVAQRKTHEACETLNRGWKAAGGDDVKECAGHPGHIYVDDPDALVEKDPGGWIIEGKDHGKLPEPSEFKDPPMRSGMAPVAAYARLTDPQTSKDAAKKAGGGNLKDIVLLHIQQEPSGVTGKELAYRTGKPLNSITPRFAQLHRAGLIHGKGKRDRQIVWHIGNGVAA